MSAGSLQSTGNALDVAIQGDGFLVSAPAPHRTRRPPVLSRRWPRNAAAINANSTAPAYDGLPTDQYTRAGNLTTDAEGFLTTASGQYVIGYATRRRPRRRHPEHAARPHRSPTSTSRRDRPTSRSARAAASPTPTTTRPTRTTADRASPATSRSPSFPNEAGLTRDAGIDWTTVAQLGRGQLRHAGHRRVRRTRRRSPASSSSRTSTWRPSSPT